MMFRYRDRAEGVGKAQPQGVLLARAANRGRTSIRAMATIATNNAERLLRTRGEVPDSGKAWLNQTQISEQSQSWLATPPACRPVLGKGGGRPELRQQNIARRERSRYEQSPNPCAGAG